MQITKQEVKNFLKSEIKKIFLFIRDDKVLELSVDLSLLEYSIKKEDIDSYILKLKIKKEK